MPFSFLIASVSTVRTNTTTVPSPTPINITNRCGIDGAVDHEFLVTFKPAAANSTDGRRLDTTEDKLSFLQGWVDQYTVDQHDSEGTYSNGTGRRKLEANSTHVSYSTRVLHFFTVTQLAVAVGASDEVRRAHDESTGPPPRVVFVPHLRPTNTCARIRPSRAWPRTRPLTRLRLTVSNAWTCFCPARRTWTRPWPAG